MSEEDDQFDASLYVPTAADDTKTVIKPKGERGRRPSRLLVTPAKLKIVSGVYEFFQLYDDSASGTLDLEGVKFTVRKGLKVSRGSRVACRVVSSQCP